MNSYKEEIEIFKEWEKAKPYINEKLYLKMETYLTEITNSNILLRETNKKLKEKLEISTFNNKIQLAVLIAYESEELANGYEEQQEREE